MPRAFASTLVNSITVSWTLNTKKCYCATVEGRTRAVIRTLKQSHFCFCLGFFFHMIYTIYYLRWFIRRRRKNSVMSRKWYSDTHMEAPLSLHIQAFQSLHLLQDMKETWIVFQKVLLASALDISNTQPQQASLVFLPQVMYHMRLFLYEKWMGIQWKSNAQDGLQTAQKSKFCTCLQMLHILMYSPLYQGSVSAAQVEILLWQNVFLNTLILSPSVSAGDSGPRRLKGHWCKQSVGLRVRFQMLSALITGLWNPSGPLNHLLKPTVGCIVWLEISLGYTNNRV